LHRSSGGARRAGHLPRLVFAPSRILGTRGLRSQRFTRWCPATVARALECPRMGDGDRRPRDGARERQRVLLLCAGVIVVLGLTDRLALGYFAWRPLVVRLLWALFVVATALNLRGAGAARTRELMLALAVFSAAFYAALAALTGGVASPLFHWMLALPVAIAVVIQDHPAAIVGSGLTMVAGGIGILAAAGTAPALAWQWSGTAAIMILLAAYVSHSYGRLHAREAALRRAGAEADTRARAS